MQGLQPGDEAPSFVLPDQSGTAVSLADFAGRKLLVYFFMKAHTPGCTIQAQRLRDARTGIGDTAVVGISPDPPVVQAGFDKKHELGFPLLADEDHAVAVSYGVYREEDGLPRSTRSAFLIDENGCITHSWYGVSPGDTAAKLLEALGAG